MPMAALADAGDHKTYNSAAEIWSDETGFSPVIKPDGAFYLFVNIKSIVGF